MIFTSPGCANREANDLFKEKSIGHGFFLLSLLSLFDESSRCPIVGSTRRGRLQWPVYAGFGYGHDIAGSAIDGEMVVTGSRGIRCSTCGNGRADRFFGEQYARPI